MKKFDFFLIGCFAAVLIGLFGYLAYEEFMSQKQNEQSIVVKNAMDNKEIAATLQAVAVWNERVSVSVTYILYADTSIVVTKPQGNAEIILPYTLEEAKILMEARLQEK